MDKEAKKLIDLPHGESPREMTFKEWLSSGNNPLPEGFTEWPIAEYLWDYGYALDRAVAKYEQHLKLKSHKLISG